MVRNTKVGKVIAEYTRNHAPQLHAGHVMPRDSDQCPYCYEQVSGIYDAFVGLEYPDEFLYRCPHCHRKVLVTVVSVPSFEVYRAITYKEKMDSIKQWQEKIAEKKGS